MPKKMNKKLITAIICLLAATFCHAQDNTTNPDSTATESDSLRWEKMLEGVTVKAQRQLIKTEIDRIGYDVQADEESKTDNILDMLKKVPFVSVDAQENIRVKGNSQYKIYRNGHYDPNLSKNAKELFRSMPASLVKRIEVITDPGAKEDAEGVNAILNIVMMENQAIKGLTGTVSTRATTKGSGNINASLTTQIGKVITSVDYGAQRMSESVTKYEDIAEDNFIDSGNTIRSEVEGSNPGYFHFADISASYDIDSLNLLSASFGGYFYDMDVKGSNTCVNTDPDGNPIYSYGQTYNLPSYAHQSWNGRADYEHRTRRKGETLTLSYMLAFTRQRTVQKNQFHELVNAPFDYTQNEENTRERFTEHTFQLDWTRPLWEGHTLSTGLKYIERRNSSHTLQDFNDEPKFTSYDNRFNHNTHIAAAYADYMYTHGKWSARAGLRYEHSYMSAHYPDGKGEDFGRHINDWVPQASMKYQFNDRQSLKLTYSTSISRPGIGYLNPAVIINPNAVQSGNPSLKSAHSQSVSLNYLLTGERITLQIAPSFDFWNGGIGRVVNAREDVRYLTYGNIERMRRFSTEGYIQWKPFSKTTVIANATLMYDHLENRNAGLSQHGWSAYFFASASQQLPWRLRLSANAWGNLGNQPNNVYSYSRPYTIYGIFLQRSFLDEDRLTVSLRAISPFNKTNRQTTITNHGDYTGFDKQIMNIRRFEIAVSFRFGKLKASVKKAGRSIENSDVVGGIQKGNQ